MFLKYFSIVLLLFSSFVYAMPSYTRVLKGTNYYVYKYDNGDDYVKEGLFRIIDDNGLFGFANEQGIVVIKPQFFFAFPFENGKAKVTLKGSFKKVGEYYEVNSTNWFYIDKNSNIVEN